MKENKKLVSEIIEDIRRDMTDEEVLALLASSRVSENTVKETKKSYTLGQRAADKIARFAGSWAFIFSFVGVLLLWMAVNIIMAADAFDPYPFILLNLVLSCVAAIQAPLIMMSQNRQEEKDRRRAENDYKVNLKTEIMIEDMHDKLNRILSRQELLVRYIRQLQEESGGQASAAGDAERSAATGGQSAENAGQECGGQALAAGDAERGAAAGGQSAENAGQECGGEKRA